MKTVFALALSATCLACAAAANAGTIYGPHLRMKAVIDNDQFQLTLRVIPSYRVTKPGVRVTITRCRLGQQMAFKVIDPPGLIPGNENYFIRPYSVSWVISRVPAAPDFSKIQFNLALPQNEGGPDFCVHVAMHDNYTGKTVGRDLRLTIPPLVGSSD